MGNNDGVDTVLATLPNGSRVLSTLRPGRAQPDHVYRVLSVDGTLVQEFLTLVELTTFLSGYAPVSGPSDAR